MSSARIKPRTDVTYQARPQAERAWPSPSIVPAISLLILLCGSLVHARPPRPAPPPPGPSVQVINVATEAQLQVAMETITSNVTIVLAPGTYRLTRSLYFSGAFKDIGIRGATGNADDVVLVGPGITQNNYG